MRYSFLIIVSLIVSACSTPSGKPEKTFTPMKVVTEVHGDTLAVNGPLILFMWPDSLQAEKMKAKNSDAFYTEADDFSFYNSQLMDIADSLRIKNFNTTSKFLDFCTTDNKHIVMNRSGNEDLWWGLLLFNGKDTPALQTSVDIDSKYLNNYFRQ